MIPTEYVAARTQPSEIDLCAIMARRGWRDVIIKPSVAASSRGALRVRQTDGREALEKAQNYLVTCCTVGPPPDPLALFSGHRSSTEPASMMVQPYMASVETRGTNL